VPAAREAQLRPWLERPVTLGLRPEHIRTLTAPDAPVAPVDGVVRFVEHMGSEVFVHFEVGGAPFTARVSADPWCGIDSHARGVLHRFGFQMEKSHVFDAHTGRNLFF
jgi:oligogalacturonide transport system ATP-binding protein